MYTAQAAIGVRLGLNQRWEVIDLTAWVVADLFSTFRRVQLTLLPAGSTTPVYFDLSTLAASYATYPGLVSAMLSALGSTTLPTTLTGLRLNSQKAVYGDAFSKGYTANPVSTVNTVDPGVEGLKQPNIRLTNTQIAVDYQQMFDYCLVNINGYYHRVDTDGTNGLMVIDAMKCVVKANQNQIGLWSFTEVGALTQVPITSGMVTTSSSQTQASTVTLPVDPTGKSVFLILGGYLVLVDGTALTQISHNGYTIDFSRLSIVDRYYESLNYLDLSSLGVNTPSTNGSVLAVTDLTTPAMMLKWLLLSQSFFVVVDTPELYSQTLAVKRTGLPMLYTTYQQPRSPLVLELGRHPPYVVKEEVNQYSLSLYNNTVGNKLYYSNVAGYNLSTSGANMPGMPGHLSQAYLLELGRDV